MTYRTVFDLARPGVPFEPFLLIPLVLTAVGALLIFMPGLMNTLMPGGLKGSARVIFSWFYFLFAATLSIVFLTTYYSSYFGMRQTLRTGQAAVVEGCLETFHPMPQGGHDEERIKVGGRVLTYSDYILTSGFNQSESHGGPIHADSRVRIHAVGDTIARLEVIDHACPPARRD
jgi:hypothetical protein